LLGRQHHPGSPPTPSNPERFGDRTEGAVTLEFLGAPGEAAEPHVPGPGEGLLEQERLADSGFALDEDKPPTEGGCPIQCRHQLAQFGPASDHGPARRRGRRDRVRVWVWVRVTHRTVPHRFTHVIDHCAAPGGWGAWPGAWSGPRGECQRARLTASSTLEDSPSFSRACETWDWTVRREMKRWRAMSGLERPSAT